MKTSESIANIAAALSRVQGKLTGAEANSTNPHFRSKFANLESIWKSIRSQLSDEGLSVSQPISMTADGKPSLVTMLMHKSGEFIMAEQVLIMGKMDPQGVVSATTYARRNALAAIISQVTLGDENDDDGEGTKGNSGTESNQASEIPPGSTNGNGNGSKPKLVSEAQLKRLFAIQKQHGVTDAQVEAHIKSIGLTSRKDLNRQQYDALIAKIEAVKKS